MEILKRKFSIEESNSKDIRVGDVIELPVFTAPEVTVSGAIMGGTNELHFDEQVIKDTATVYDIKGNKLYLVFDHALFKSSVDNNNECEWKNTQLCRYLEEQFKPAMNKVGIPAKKVSLLSKDELFGDNPLPFFRNGRNRVAFDKDEGYARYHWLKTPYKDKELPSGYFCRVNDNGYPYHDHAIYANCFVRPCFIIQQR